MSALNEDVLFEVESTLGVRIRTTESYWEKITKQKHPRMRGMEEEVRGTLKSPEQIRRSQSDSDVLLYYKPHGDYHVCVVVRHENGSGFVITAYMTDTIKEGDQVWPE